MTRELVVLDCGPGLTVQDRGRPGYIASGASVGGAADFDALHEGATLLNQSVGCAALEMAGSGGKFRVTKPARIALTGAAMTAQINETSIHWNCSYPLLPEDILTIGQMRKGNYGYLSVGGGIATPTFLGSRSTHLVARIGEPVRAGSKLPLGADSGQGIGLCLTSTDRFNGGTIRILPSVQTERFSDAEISRLQNTEFTRDPRGNRMGARMAFEGAPFHADGLHSLVSEMVVPGDIQITGDGTPFVLLGECQTTGGYPRIGTVIPSDIPHIAQARPGDPIRFQMIPREQALAAYAAHQKHLQQLKPYPRVRDPHDIPDLLAYQLISGAVSGEEK